MNARRALRFFSSPVSVTLFGAFFSALLASCSSSSSPESTTAADAGVETKQEVNQRLDQIFAGATDAQSTVFNTGSALFDAPFYPADGLGPVYVNTACGQCHGNGLRGPGFDQRMVMVNDDGFTPADDQSPIAYGNEIRAQVVTQTGAMTPVVPPNLPNVKITTRTPPSIVGRGYMEAVLDSEIERMESEQATRTDGIHGVINHVTYNSETSADVTFNPFVKGQMVIGRFGLKARIATLDDFAADAFQNDMGITSALRPVELLNPDGITDDMKPGVDIDQDHIDIIANIAVYMRLQAIPARVDPDPAAVALFAQAQCSVCHAPTLKTRPDYPIAQLANIDAPIFTDFLLHDMGNEYADGMRDGSATTSQFRTSPLIALRYLKAYMHDGRVHSVADAINAHTGEATVAAQAFQAMSADDQASLIAYVSSL